MIFQNYIERRLQDGVLNLDDSGKATQRLITPTKPNLDNRKYVPGMQQQKYLFI